MSLDIEAIFTALRQVIDDSIGSSLHQYSSGSAIIKLHGAGTKPKYPYATMSILNTSDYGSYLMNKTLDQDTGITTYDVHKDLTINIAVRANDYYTSYDLCNKLHSDFKKESVLTYLQDTIEASVASQTSTRTQIEVLQDRLNEFEEFEVVLRMNDQSTEDNGYITTVEPPQDNLINP